VNIVGEYALTFVADSACADLPNDLRTRTYAATITPNPRADGNSLANSSVLVTLRGAGFLGDLNSFEIGIAGDYLGFWLHGGHDPPIVEQLATGTYLAFSGNAATSVGSGMATISALLDGWIDYCVMKSAMGSVYNCGTSNFTGEPIPGLAVTRVHCESKNHRIVLTRQ
jgi:hypothetical protein